MSTEKTELFLIRIALGFTGSFIGTMSNTGMTFRIYAFGTDYAALITPLPGTYLNGIYRIIQTTVGNLI